ncbi:hypothetical protein CsatB_011301 [Cannabis sativa]|uniref:C2HC zinc finger plants domain-containing protein n=1 Tax=Cannabis sativa TaxID=3483 RepID=A0A7J6I2V1_CANSA|nr:uncharacterized protein LOC115706096 [Cannabis sativa]KAF4367998.1 hypothetical protein F8388_002609 [Cannabis sativa]KAF4401318.1 hypothetical protein G4B88_014159 [Cannabis sativa]
MDHRTEAELTHMEMETETAVQPDEVVANATTSSSNHGNPVWDLLTLARHLINQGKPSQALQAVVMAMRSEGGDEAVFRSLHRARELYQSRLRDNAAADQLASLFAECAIAEAQPLKAELVRPNYYEGESLVVGADDGGGGTSILAESGRMQIVLDAFSDGSSFICLQCGGLVSNNRRDEHYAYWCCQI